MFILHGVFFVLGPRLEEILVTLLDTMLDHYEEILEKNIQSISEWKRPLKRAILHVLRILNHGATQFSSCTNLISSNLSIIDSIIIILNNKFLYDHIKEELDNTDTIFMHCTIELFSNLIYEPKIMAHVKQKQTTKTFFKLTQAKYEPIQLKSYMILAHIMDEEDIKTMTNPGKLLSTVINTLKQMLDMSGSITNKQQRESNVEMLTETLKGECR